MGILNNFLDKFKNAEFTVAPQKKLKTISADFKKAFELSLVFYKGVKIGIIGYNGAGKQVRP